MEKTYLNSVDIPDPVAVKYVNSFPPEKWIFKYLCEDNIEYERYMYHHFYDCHDLNIRTFFNGDNINDMRRCLFPVDTYIKSVVLPTIGIIWPLLAKGLMKVKVIQPIVKPITPEDIIRYPHLEWQEWIRMLREWISKEYIGARECMKAIRDIKTTWIKLYIQEYMINDTSSDGVLFIFLDYHIIFCPPWEKFGDESQ